MGNIKILSMEGSGVTRWEDIISGLGSLTKWVPIRRALSKSEARRHFQG
jgi:hypothetical protein